MSMLVYIEMALNEMMLAFWGKDQLILFLLQGERIFKVGRLAGDDGLECIIKPFPEGMDEACAIRADGRGSSFGLVDFYH